MKIEEIKRVVVRGTNWVGDAAMSVPALRALRRVVPAAEIVLSVRRPVDEIFLEADFVDRVWVYEKRKSAAANVFREARRWRAARFDLAILLPNSFESAILARAGRVRFRIGYNTDKRSFLLTDAVPVPAWKKERHEVFYYLNLVAELERKLYGAAKISLEAPEISLNISNERKENAREILRAAGADLSRPTIVLCPGSTNSRAKRWHAESFAKLSNLIVEKLNGNVILTGAPDELAVSQEVFDKAGRKPLLLTGKINLAQSIAVLSAADLLVTNDTGPAHLAPAVRTKTIVIFGPTVPTTTRPFSDLAEIIRKPPECAPCMLRDCPIDHRCMTGVLPEEVFAAAQRVLFQQQ